MLTDSSMQLNHSNGDFTFKPIQWERLKTSVQSLQQITMTGIEEVMESQVYGIEVSN